MRAKRLFLLAPGAGAPSSSPWMRALASRLAPLGTVETFDYPYALAGRRAPDRRDALIAAHRSALERARDAHPRATCVLVGKSMGGRIGCHVAVAAPDAARALVCLGYPLAGRDPGRTGVLLELETPILFVQGTRDALCPLQHLDEVRARMRAPNELFVVPDGDHSLLARKGKLSALGTTQAALDAGVIAAIAAFLERFAPAP